LRCENRWSKNIVIGKGLRFHIYWNGDDQTSTYHTGNLQITRLAQTKEDSSTENDVNDFPEFGGQILVEFH